MYNTSTVMMILLQLIDSKIFGPLLSEYVCTSFVRILNFLNKEGTLIVLNKTVQSLEKVDLINLQGYKFWSVDDPILSSTLFINDQKTLVSGSV